MNVTESPVDARAPLEKDELSRLQERSDSQGLKRLALHGAAILTAGTVYALSVVRAAPFGWQALAAVTYGFTLVTMFAAMHESVHRTAFRSQRLNDRVAWLAGLLSFYNSTFYRPYHGWHHRFTQRPGQDPELDDPKPRSLVGYAVELSGLTWWLGKLRTHATLALGRTSSYPFLSDTTGPAAVRSVRLQLAVYGCSILASIGLGQPYFVVYWLIPVAVAQPLLRAILLAEHTGCSEDDDPLANTRTTHTIFPVRLLMWEMPYHAEHHRYPALPFFSLAAAHEKLGPHLAFVARQGYLGFNAGVLKALAKGAAPGRAA